MLKQISLEEAFEEVANGGAVYVLTQMTEDTTVGYLQEAAGLCMVVPDIDEADEEPEPEEVPELEVSDTDEYTEIVINAEKEPEPDKKPERKNINKYDHGKIIALHNAGWSVAKIADEIRCNTQTVYNHLAKEGIKGGK